MPRNEVKIRAIQILSWGMVLFWMAVIFWFSSQPADESVRWSVGVMEAGRDVLTNWQLVGIVSFILLYHVFLIWLARLKTHWLVKTLLFIAFVLLSIFAVYVLYTMVRPRVGALGIFQMNRWVIHRQLRKFAHFIIFLFLGTFLINALTVSNVTGWKAIVIALFVSFIYAISDELHQHFVPGRTPLVMDVMIDTAGAAVGIILYSFVNGLFKLVRRLTHRYND
ncbi:VanZ family protein [Alkalibacterium sp.]|nr:MAG: VanZ family protein [Alkalibacterium sp.]